MTRLDTPKGKTCQVIGNWVEFPKSSRKSVKKTFSTLITTWGLRIFIIGVTLNTVSLACFAEESQEWFTKGNTLSSQGRLEEAVEAYHKSIEANPDSTGTWFNLGLAYKGLKKYERSAAAFEQSLRLEPDNIFIRLKLGNIYNLLENWEKAIGHLNYVVHRLPNNPEAHGNLGWAYFNYKKEPPFKMLVIVNLEKAVKLFEKQNLKEAAKATRKTLEAAKEKFGYNNP